MRRTSRMFYAYLFFMFFVMAVIFCFSAQSGDDSGEVSNHFLLWILSWAEGTVPKVLVDFVKIWIRKIAHFSIYMILGIVSCKTIQNAPDPSGLSGRGGHDDPQAAWQWHWYHGWFIAVIYACTDEFHQYFVPGRACQLRDVLIDSAGAFAGVIIVYMIGYCKNYIESCKKLRKNYDKI